MNIEISDVRYSPYLDPEKRTPIIGPKGLKGFASCVINDSFFLGNIAIFTKLNKEGYRLIFPIRISEKKKEFKIYFPLKREIYDELMKLIVEQIQKKESEDQI